jgi:lipoyl(octanoyl) transferase
MESVPPSHIHKTNIRDMAMDGIMADGNPENRCPVIDLGQAEYGAVYQLQKKIHSRRVKGEISDVVFMLEHSPTYTIGKSGTVDNVLVSKERLEEENISLFFIERGGDITYHGPGQLVVYPIFDLSKRDKDIRRYVRDLEEVMIRTLEDFSIRGCRDESHAGVWVNGEEIGAIGISVRKWITMHGIALNVDPVMEHFSYINPCGFVDRRATSISEVLGRNISLEEVRERFLFHFSDVFNLNMDPQTLSEFERHEKKGTLPAWFKKNYLTRVP